MPNDSPFYLNIPDSMLFSAIASAIDRDLPVQYYGNPNGNIDSLLPGKTCYDMAGAQFFVPTATAWFGQHTTTWKRFLDDGAGLYNLTGAGGINVYKSGTTFTISGSSLGSGSGSSISWGNVAKAYPQPVIDAQGAKPILPYGYSQGIAGVDSKVTSMTLPGIAIAGCLGPDGNLYFTSTSAGNRVYKSSPDGGTQSTFSTGVSAGVVGIVSGPDGNLWYAATGNIGKVTTSGTVTNYAYGGGSSATDIIVGPDRNLWFVDPVGKLVGKCTTAGTITTYTTSTFRPQHICAGGDGKMYFTGSNGDNGVWSITTAGVITKIASPPTTCPQGTWAISLDQNGVLWVNQDINFSGGNNASTFTCTTAGVTAVINNVGNLQQTACSGPDGAIYFSQAAQDRIVRYDTLGNATNLDVTGTNNNAQYQFFGPNGNLYVPGGNGGVIKMIPVPITMGTIRITESIKPYVSGSADVGTSALPFGNVYTNNLSGSPAISGTATGVTQASNDNSTKLATTAYAFSLVSSSSGQGSSSSTSNAITAGNLTQAVPNNIVPANGLIQPLPYPFTISASGSTSVTEYTTLSNTGNSTGLPYACSGPDNNIWYVSSSGTFKIGKISTDGTGNTEYSTTTTPISVCAGPDGNLWYGTGSTKIGRVTTDGTVTEFSTTTATNSVCAGPDGNIWYSTNFAKIGKVTPSGTVTEYSTTSSLGTTGVCAGPDGKIWYGTALSKIGKISTDGTGNTEYSIASTISYFLCAGPDGNIWYGTNTTKIGKISTSGTGNTEYSTVSTNVRSICAGPDGNIWYGIIAAVHKIGRMSVSGVATEYPITSSQSATVLTGPDGNIWYTTGNNPKIGYKPLTLIVGSLQLTNPLAGSGTVTSVATDATLTGGTITTTGTLGIATSAAIPGSPTTTTQAINDNSTKVATTAYVFSMVSAASGGAGAVSSVTAADGTLTITPTTGAVTAKIPSSVALPGSPTTTTQALTDNSTKIATTAYAFSLVRAASGVGAANSTLPRRYYTAYPAYKGTTTVISLGTAPDLSASSTANADVLNSQYMTIGYSTSSSSGNVAYVQSPASTYIQTQPQLKPILTMISGMDSTSNAWYCVKLSPIGGDVDFFTSDTPLNNIAGFRFKPSAGDTTYQAYCSDGSNYTIVDTTVAPSNNVPHVFKLDFTNYPTSADFCVDNIVVTISLHLPAATTDWYWNTAIKTQTAAAKKLYWGSTSLISN